MSHFFIFEVFQGKILNIFIFYSSFSLIFVLFGKLMISTSNLSNENHVSSGFTLNPCFQDCNVILVKRNMHDKGSMYNK